jgi:hypothetical protein
MNEAAASVPRTHIEIKLTAKNEARFWAKVNKNGLIQPHMETQCWEWTSSKGKHGYGQISVCNRPRLAHRFSWIVANGAIQNSKHVCHHCDNRACVRPDHLFLGDHKDNMQDMFKKGRNGSNTKPERLARGDKNGARLHPERLARGEANPAAKLTKAEVIQIRELYAAGGTTLMKLGAQFGVSYAMISLIVRRQKWAHIQ